MLAWRLVDWQSDPELHEVPDPEPGPGEVVLRMGGAGLCHSDLHFLHEFEPGLLPWELPFTLGHESAGWVHSLGEGVTGLEIGQAVAVHGAYGCGRCDNCLGGNEPLCEDPFNAPVLAGGCGLGADGGLAEFVLVPAARYLVPLPDGVDPIHAAPLTDAGLTPYHAIRRSLPKLTPASTAVVIGVGGLGHMAVQLLSAVCGARIIAVDSKEQARKLALHAGADHALEPGETTAGDIKVLTGGRGADVVLDFVGADETLALAIGSARMLGDVTIVGVAGGTLPLSYFTVPFEVSIQTTYWGTRQELVEVLELAARGKIAPHITTYPFDKAAEAYAELAAGRIEGRAVVLPPTER
jgi:propanol-preferring alcohol dehydrogenase